MRLLNTSHSDLLSFSSAAEQGLIPSLALLIASMPLFFGFFLDYGNKAVLAHEATRPRLVVSEDTSKIK